MTLPGDAEERKKTPMATGLLDYFPDALAEVARCSLIANEQHNPGEHLHWAKHKSTDEADALMRHLVDRGKIDKDGVRHSTKVAWRGLALLQRELEALFTDVPEAKAAPRTKVVDVVEQRPCMEYTYTTPQRLVRGEWVPASYCGICGAFITGGVFGCLDPRCPHVGSYGVP
jgi:hypothetical protein